MFPFILNENENNWQYYVLFVCLKITENKREDIEMDLNKSGISEFQYI
jgi:hypothetical protein